MVVQDLEFLTKVLSPRRRPDVFRRQRLLDFLHEHVNLKVQLICAPAGYGKTTLLLDFANDVDIPVCWYSLGSSDRDPMEFFNTLLTSIRCRFPQFGQRTEGLMKGASDIAKDINQVMGMLTGEMYADIPELFILVLEDYHSVEEDETIKSIFNILLERAPNNCHLIISSRTYIELSTIAKLRMRREVARLERPDLSFTAQEVKQLLADHYKIQLSDGEAERLATESEGWIAGILLEASGSSPFRSAVKPQFSSQDVFNYLASEVYEKQLPKIKGFLLLSSTFQEIKPEYCKRLFKLRNSEHILGEIERRNLFISRLEGDQILYRYHSLFREFLQRKLKREQPESYMLLHRGAGSIYKDEGQWPQAIAHYLEIDSYSDALRIIKKVGESFLKAGKWQTVFKWIEALPEKMRMSEPVLTLLETESLIHLGQVDKAIQLLNRLLARLNVTADWLSLAKALSWRSAAFRLTGNFRESQDDIQNAIRILRQNKGPAEVLGDAYRRLGNIYAEQGRLLQAEKCLRRSLKLFLLVFDVNQIAAVHNSLGIVYKRLGNLSRATAHYEQASQYWKKAENYGALALTLNNMGIIYRYLGQYEKALTCLNSGLENARLAAYTRAEAWLLINLGDVRRAMGFYDEALSTYSQALALARQVIESSQVAIATAGMGTTYRLLGQLDRAEVLLKEAIAQAQERGQAYDIGLFTLQLGIVRYQQGKYKEAEQLLRGVYHQMEQMGDKDAIAKCALHIAQVSYLQRKYRNALDWLHKLSALVSELEYEEFIVTEGQGMLALLQYAASRRIGGDLYEVVITKVRERGRLAGKAKEVLCLPAVEAESLPCVKALALGQSLVLVNAKAVSESEWRSAKAKEMFFYLLCQNGRANKEEILSSLWPDVSPAKGNSLFHSNLYRLRRAVFDGAILTQNGRYLVNPALPVWFDIWEFESNLSQARRLPSASQDRVLRLEQAADVYKGPFLKEFYTDWVETMRRQLEDKYLGALCSLARFYEIQGKYDCAIELLEKATVIDEYMDEIYYRLVKCYLNIEDRPSAWRVYQRYSHILKEELGSEHSSKMERLIHSISKAEQTMAT